MMGLFDFMRAKASETSAIIVQNPGQPIWSNRDYRAFAKEAYQMNVVASQSINRISDAVASIKWQVWSGDNELDTHPIYGLLENPNPAQSGVEFIREKIGYLLIAGDGYDERVILRNEIREIYTLRPDRMAITDGPDWPWPASYVYTVGANKKTWPVEKNGHSDIRHIKLFNPLNDWHGQSPIEAGAKAIDQHNAAMAWMQSLLQNSAKPSGALVMAKDAAPLDTDNFNRLKAQIEEQYQGAANAGRPMLLEGGMDWRAMGLSPSDMALIETKNSAARDICLALGVPPQLLGIPGDNTYANYKEARLAFWEDTVLPLVDYIAAEWSSWFGQIYGDDIKVLPDLDAIPAISEKRLSLWTMADTSKDLTINERRSLKGYPDIPGGSFMPDYGFDTETPEGEDSLSAPGDVQQTALNGAQMSSIQAVVQSVADGMLPADSAVEIIVIAIPTVTRAQALNLVSPADGFVPEIDFTADEND